MKIAAKGYVVLESSALADEAEGVENINYLQAIKRVIGMSDKPLANE